jgi:hypothetical protein
MVSVTASPTVHRSLGVFLVDFCEERRNVFSFCPLMRAEQVVRELETL